MDPNTTLANLDDLVDDPDLQAQIELLAEEFLVRGDLIPLDPAIAASAASQPAFAPELNVSAPTPPFAAIDVLAVDAPGFTATDRPTAGQPIPWTSDDHASPAAVQVESAVEPEAATPAFDAHTATEIQQPLLGDIRAAIAIDGGAFASPEEIRAVVDEFGDAAENAVRVESARESVSLPVVVDSPLPEATSLAPPAGDAFQAAAVAEIANDVLAESASVNANAPSFSGAPTGSAAQSDFEAAVGSAPSMDALASIGAVQVSAEQIRREPHVRVTHPHPGVTVQTHLPHTPAFENIPSPQMELPRSPESAPGLESLESLPDAIEDALSEFSERLLESVHEATSQQALRRQRQFQTLSFHRSALLGCY